MNGILYLFKDGNLDLLRQMNVKYILSDEELDTDKTELVKFVNNNYIYRLLDNLPRAYCASDYINAAPGSDIVPVYIDALERFDRPVIGTDLPVSAGPLPTSCTVKTLKTYINKLDFQVSTAEKSIVLIPYSFNKFWRTQINGQKGRSLSRQSTANGHCCTGRRQPG